MERHSLNGSWQCVPTDGNQQFSATVPGDVYSDLMAAGQIPDPYEADNELDVQWVAERDWCYRRTVEVDDTLLSEERQTLVCHGLDTVATVRVNDITVGTTDNMHRRYEFPVGDALEPGVNDIEIRFRSPVEYSSQRAADHPYDVPVMRYPQDEPDRNHIRKAACHYGWDWGPCLPTMGIWRDVELVGHSGPRITYTKSRQDHHDDGVDLTVDVGLDVPTDCEATLTASVAGATETTTVSIDGGTAEHTLELTVADPDLWWPNGYGDQPLYDLTVTVESDHDTETTTDRVGFREIELCREEDDTGESFFFEVNGVPVFAKGANWIPMEALHGRIDETEYADLLDSAASANMNMIRVWGGGHYERDAFYERCDELGLLVWQDFMFACSLYPADDGFRETVASEARYQVRRLANHPSLALWCGNNENEQGLHNWWADEDHIDSLEADYEAIFLETLDQIVTEEDPSRPYWSASPSSGREYDDPYMTERGDIHYWDVWHSGASFDAYEETEPRFVSEFGYQSFPSPELLASILPENELNPTAPLMEHHQRSPGGNGRILSRMTDNFRTPFSFGDFAYLSQIQQSMAMQTAIEHWRRRKPHTMGALYWQLNDLWPCASWSSIEYGGDWKASQYVARRIFAPLLVSTTVTDEGVSVWLTSDRPEAISGTLTVTVWTLDGERVHTESHDTTVSPLDSTAALTVDIDAVASEIDPSNCLVRADFDGPVESYPSVAFQEPYKRLDLRVPDIKVDVEGASVTLETDVPALWVSLDAPLSGAFSDNYFHLLPGESRTITVESDADRAAITSALAELDVTHLRETH